MHCQRRTGLAYRFHRQPLKGTFRPDCGISGVIVDLMVRKYRLSASTVWHSRSDSGLIRVQRS